MQRTKEILQSHPQAGFLSVDRQFDLLCQAVDDGLSRAWLQEFLDTALVDPVQPRYAEAYVDLNDVPDEDPAPAGGALFLDEFDSAEDDEDGGCEDDAFDDDIDDDEDDEDFDEESVILPMPEDPYEDFDLAEAEREDQAPLRRDLRPQEVAARENPEVDDFGNSDGW